MLGRWGLLNIRMAGPTTRGGTAALLGARLAVTMSHGGARQKTLRNVKKTCKRERVAWVGVATAIVELLWRRLGYVNEDTRLLWKTFKGMKARR
ncbi:hypothetical protein NL676_013721 [Syzygium grande]|nr:hypothetical protein NL676_013721 [Syzygium grande]